MSFVLQGEVRIDGKTAKGEIKDLERAQDKLKKSTKSLSGEGKKAASSNRQMGVAARKAASDYDRLSGAERRAAREATTFGLASQTAAIHTRGMAGGMRNLGLQLNQVAQVGGMTGNWMQAIAIQLPDMLLGFGSLGIAAGILAGAMIPLVNSWADGTDEAVKLEQALDDAASAIEAFGTKADRAGQSMAGMLAEFGTASPELRAVLTDLAALAKIEAYKGIDETADSVRRLVLETGRALSLTNINASKDFLGLFSIRGSAYQAGVEFARNLDLLSKSEEPAVKLRAALDVRKQLLNTAGGIEKLNSEQKEFYNGLAAIIRDLSVLEAKVAAGSDPIKERSAAAVQFFQEVLKGRFEQQAAAEDMLATLKEENTLRWAIVKFGEDSVEVETLRAVAAKNANEKMLATRNISEDLKNELRAAFLEGQNLSNMDVSGTIGAAADEAARLADNLATAQGARIDRLVGGNVDFFDPRNETGTAGVITRPRPNPQVNSGAGRGGVRNGGAGGGGADAQAQAIARLIEQQQLQLATLRESDPVMREMLRYRVAMAGATKEQRALLEKLITTRLREEDVLERVQETQSFFQDTAYDALDGMISRGESFGDVMKNVAASIAQAALQAALLGTGPLASLFGSAGGGLLGFIGDALFPEIPAAADGGYLSGPGTGTSDDILMWGSNGEFMVNAAATARHRGLLEAINSGATPPELAAGGLIATSSPSQVAVARSPRDGVGQTNDPAPSQVTLRIIPSREFTTQIEETAERISVEVVGDYDRDVIPGSVQRVLENPRRVG
jgi:hypothetical protein